MSIMRDITKYLHRLWKVDFVSDSAAGDVETIRAEVISESEATAVSSEVVNHREEWDFLEPNKYREVLDGHHTIMIDVDVPARLLASTTLGHFHLYVDIDPVPWEKYERWLIASADIGLIEPGYLRASQERKATFLRVPWVKKTEGDK